MSDSSDRAPNGRRNFIRTSLAAVGGMALPGFATRAMGAENHPAIGTWPAGAEGNSVFIGIAVTLLVAVTFLNARKKVQDRKSVV